MDDMPVVNRPLAASVVGGGVGGQLSVQALSNSPNFALRAVADRNERVREQIATQYPGVRTFSSHEMMFTECPTDVVCVSTYPSSHEEVALAALQLPLAGILVEKPLGDTYAAGRRILDAIEGRRLPVVVPHGLLARATPLDVLQCVRRGCIGVLSLVEVQCAHLDIINAGIHWVNFFVHLIGDEPIHSVLAACDTTSRTRRYGLKVETDAVTYLRSASGARMIMNTGDDTPVAAEGVETLFRLVGSEGIIEFAGWVPGYRLMNADHPTGMVIMPDELYKTPHQVYLDNLAAMIASNSVDYSLAKSSLRALEACEAAYVSNRYRCTIHLPLAAFTPPTPSDWDAGTPYAGEEGSRDGWRL